MDKINYDGRIFKSVKNSETGEVSSETRFYYHQTENLVWAQYAGGRIVFGSLIAKCDEEGNLDMRYQHLNKNGELMTGKCVSAPEILGNGKIRLHENWQWTSGDLSKGTSVVEEI
ncbi:MAG TPA: hypothetical protein VGC76_05400 [Pyrinomonadaceae bacterium]|jgi:hypothetical protein